MVLVLDLLRLRMELYSLLVAIWNLMVVFMIATIV